MTTPHYLRKELVLIMEMMKPSRRIGYAYVPMQIMDKVYSPNKAICAGTIFPELDIPIDEYERGLFNGK